MTQSTAIDAGKSRVSQLLANKYYNDESSQAPLFNHDQWFTLAESGLNEQASSQKSAANDIDIIPGQQTRGAGRSPLLCAEVKIPSKVHFPNIAATRQLSQALNNLSNGASDWKPNEAGEKSVCCKRNDGQTSVTTSIDVPELIWNQYNMCSPNATKAQQDTFVNAFRKAAVASSIGAHPELLIRTHEILYYNWKERYRGATDAMITLQQLCEFQGIDPKQLKNVQRVHQDLQCLSRIRIEIGPTDAQVLWFEATSPTDSFCATRDTVVTYRLSALAQIIKHDGDRFLSRFVPTWNLNVNQHWILIRLANYLHSEWRLNSSVYRLNPTRAPRYKAWEEYFDHSGIGISDRYRLHPGAFREKFEKELDYGAERGILSWKQGLDNIDLYHRDDRVAASELCDKPRGFLDYWLQLRVCLFPSMDDRKYLEGLHCDDNSERKSNTGAAENPYQSGRK